MEFPLPSEDVNRMIASLPMYDFPELRGATDQFWKALADRLNVSAELLRGEDWTLPWRSPDLLFSQTCGYPLTHEFRGVLNYVATPHYAADGSSGPYYCSMVFAREAKPLVDFSGTTAALNSYDSMSGMLALKLVFDHFTSGGVFFKGTIQTGSHVASLFAVQQGKADVCAIDCVTVAYLKQYRPSALAGLVEVGRSPEVPGLPFVTRCGDVAVLRQALAAVFEEVELAEMRAALLLTGCTVMRLEDYGRIVALEESQHIAC